MFVYLTYMLLFFGLILQWTFTCLHCRHFQTDTVPVIPMFWGIFVVQIQFSSLLLRWWCWTQICTTRMFVLTKRWKLEISFAISEVCLLPTPAFLNYVHGGPKTGPVFFSGSRSTCRQTNSPRMSRLTDKSSYTLVVRSTDDCLRLLSNYVSSASVWCTWHENPRQFASIFECASCLVGELACRRYDHELFFSCL